MAKIHTSQDDEILIQSIIGRNGLGGGGNIPKYYALRIALALSLSIEEPPSVDFDVYPKGKEYHLEQVIASGSDENADLSDLFIAIIGQYFNKDFFSDPQAFPVHLQRLIRRGLHEIRTSWKESHDLHEYLYQELFSAAPSPDSEKTIDHSQALVSTLHELGIAAQINKVEDGPRVRRYHIALDKPQSYSKLRQRLGDISFSLGLKGQGIFLQTSGPAVASLDIPKPTSQWDIIHADNLINWLRTAPEEYRLPICTGVDVTGEPLYFDLVDCPHLMVAGTTGAGKSVCLHAILLSALLKHKPSELSICLIDPKRVEFKPYEKIPHLFGGKVFTEPEDFLEALGELVSEMEFREKHLEHCGCSSLEEAIASNKLDFPRIIVFIEELADLIMQEPDAEGFVIRLAQKARSAGIHLVIATQRPDSQTFTGILRSNIPSRIALTVQKQTESKIILEDSGAESLTGKGDMLIKLIGKEPVRAHGILINKASVEKYLKQL